MLITPLLPELFSKLMLYGGVFEQFKDLEFFKKVQVYVDEMWAKFNQEGYVECPISKYRYEKLKLEEMKL